MALSRDEIRSKLRAFILDTFLAGEPPESLKDSTQLIRSGVVSSLGIQELSEFLESEFEITLEAEDVTPEQLDTVDLIVALVEKRRAAKQTPA